MNIDINIKPECRGCATNYINEGRFRKCGIMRVYPLYKNCPCPNCLIKMKCKIPCYKFLDFESEYREWYLREKIHE